MKRASLWVVLGLPNKPHKGCRRIKRAARIEYLYHDDGRVEILPDSVDGELGLIRAIARAVETYEHQFGRGPWWPKNEIGAKYEGPLLIRIADTFDIRKEIGRWMRRNSTPNAARASAGRTLR